MSRNLLGWLQLKAEKVRFTVAVLGVAFAVTLIFMQIGFREAMFDSGVRLHRSWDFDIALLSPESVALIRAKTFTERRLFQALALPEVISASPVYLSHGLWKDVNSGETHDLFAVGFDPGTTVFRLQAVREQVDLLKMEDFVLFDSLARPEFGPVGDTVTEQGYHEVEVNAHTVQVRGMFALGTSFGIDGILVAGTDNFLRMFPERARRVINVGLLRISESADIDAVVHSLRSYLPGDVEVLTRDEFIQKEMDFWDRKTPIGYVFGFGIVVGLVVGGIIVYQILFSGVSKHLPEYATLKAMGYSNTYLGLIVMQQATILAVLGFVPGIPLANYLYEIAGDALKMELILTPQRIAAVFVLTLFMCILSGLLATRKLRAADPASIF